MVLVCLAQQVFVSSLSQLFLVS